jgi:hypothetical protein
LECGTAENEPIPWQLRSCHVVDGWWLRPQVDEWQCWQENDGLLPRASLENSGAKKETKRKHVELEVHVLQGAAPGRVAALRDFATPLEIAVEAHGRSGKQLG